MFRKTIIATLLCFLLMSPVTAFARSENSHYVHPYCRKDGVCVRGHMAGNPHSGEHWHLNKDGSDTDTHPNGTRETIPHVAPPK
jgi:hypothetical protein